jgi:hypothetical protein
MEDDGQSTTTPITLKDRAKILYEKAKNVSKDTYLTVFFFLVLVAGIIYMIVYMVSMSTKQQRECDFMNDLYPSMNGHLRGIDSETSERLHDFYIKTAYNCCSGGNMKSDYVDVCNLKAVLKTGVRGLDFEIYNIENEPVVATSTTENFYVKETFNYIPFSTVMDVVSNYAFGSGNSPNSTDPLLIHLRMKSNNQTMYSNLAEIFKNYSSIMLGKNYSYENSGKNIGATPLKELKGKVLLIIDKSNPAFVENKDLMEYVNLTSNSMFMRVYRYTNVKNVSDLQELQEYNKKNMTIVLPDNEIDPSNPNGILCREAGCQMIAMRYQKEDNFLDEYNSFFDDYGVAFVLKPENLRFREITIPEPGPQNVDYDYGTRHIDKGYFSLNI